jgi:[protein-PII] uridylyltransferase
MNNGNTGFWPDSEITMQNGREAIAKQFEDMKEAFFAGVTVNELVLNRSMFIDELMLRLYRQFNFNEYKTLSLVAVGGYGRSDLQPHSDIDILLISREPITEALNEQISKFTSLLWDLRLDIGQSVRTLEECFEEGAKDVTIATNYLESRFLAGSEETYDMFKSRVESDMFWPITDFYRAKMAEQNARHSSHKDTIYMLEPDLKNNPGGLRDIQNILWIAHKGFGITGLRELYTNGLLTRMEYLELTECQDFLWRMRFALHLSINKPDNRLTFDRQQKVATYLGYTGEGNTPVETLMKRFYQTLHRVVELNEISMQLMYEKIFPERVIEGKIFNQYFLFRDNLIDVIDPKIFVTRPQIILELFLILTEREELTGIHVNCIRYLRNARRSINYHLYERSECRDTFKRIISHPRALVVALPIMHKHHILSLYMPHWENIVGLMQFDMFHTYTVDEHTMRVLRNIYSFTHEKDSEFSLFRQIYSHISMPELLFIAALFHDIAKGQGGHHAELGAPEALYFCQLHGYNRYESKLVAWVVRNHLYMSMVAQRRDISSPEVVAEFARRVGDENLLNYLYCLTVADICGTNDTEWNSYKDTLLRTLYFEARDALRKGLENPPDLSLHVRENQKRAMEILTAMGNNPLDIFKIWTNLRPEYFIRYLPEQIAWHTQNIINHSGEDRPLVLFGQNKATNGTELFVYAKNSNGLFARVTGVLAEKNLNVLASIISNTSNNYALDTFTFVDNNDSQIDFDRIPAIRKAISTALAASEFKPSRIKPMSQKLKQFKHPTIVTFLDDSNKSVTSFEISTLDIPGLLAKIAGVFSDNELVIHAAKITTTGERADDFFTVTDKNGNAISQQGKESLREQLVSKLDAVNSED